MESNIIENINEVAKQLYASVENEVFPLLDDMVIISSKITENDIIHYIFNIQNFTEMFAFIICFVILSLILYVIQILTKMYNDEPNNIAVKQILKYLICAILATSACYICTLAIDINYNITQIILSIGHDITGKEISFLTLKEMISSIDSKSRTPQR